MPAYLVHGGIAPVGVETGHALHGAAEQRAKELVQMGQQEAVRAAKSPCQSPEKNRQCSVLSWLPHSLLFAGVVVGGLVHLEGIGTAAVEEVDRLALVLAGVGRGQHSVKVGRQVDRLVVACARGENAGNADANIGHGI